MSSGPPQHNSPDFRPDHGEDSYSDSDESDDTPSTEQTQRPFFSSDVPFLIQVGLVPREPSDAVEEGLQRKVENFHHKVSNGLNFNSYLRNRKFHNPSFLDEVAARYDIDQFGTNYPSSLYDPSNLKEEDMYKQVEKQQQAYEKKRDEMKRDRTSVAFTAARPLHENSKRKERPSISSNNPSSTHSNNAAHNSVAAAIERAREAAARLRKKHAQGQ